MTDDMPDMDELDIIDELELEVLGDKAPAAIARAEAKKAQEEIEAIDEKNPLVEIFLGKDIRVIGTVKRPLFCAADIAKYIGDVSYRVILKNYESAATNETGAYLHKIDFKGRDGAVKKMLFLTESGLYRYLLRSDHKKAIEFQIYVYDLIQVERDRVVDAKLLKEKIAKTLLQKQLNDEKLKLAMSRSDTERAMCAANDAREELRRLKSQAAKKTNTERAREHARLVALEEENRTRGPFESAHRF